jgi:hypothetical protein
MIIWNYPLIDVVLHDEDRRSCGGWIEALGYPLITFVATKLLTAKCSNRLRSLIALYTFLVLSFVARVVLSMKDHPRSRPF